MWFWPQFSTTPNVRIHTSPVNNFDSDNYPQTTHFEQFTAQKLAQTTSRVVVNERSGLRIIRPRCPSPYDVLVWMDNDFFFSATPHVACWLCSGVLKITWSPICVRWRPAKTSRKYSRVKIGKPEKMLKSKNKIKPDLIYPRFNVN